MNREVIFRGKRVDNGEWVEGYIQPHTNKNKMVILSLYNDHDWIRHEVDPSTIGQYTGLTDKNGAKIWEGDRLRIPADLWIGEQSVGKNKGTFNDDAFVEYHGGSFRINQIGNDAKLYYGVIDFSRNTGADVAEVIGTIHDPHLNKQS